MTTRSSVAAMLAMCGIWSAVAESQAVHAVETSAQEVLKPAERRVTIANDLLIAPPRGPVQMRAIVQMTAGKARVPIGMELGPAPLLPPHVVVRPTMPTIHLNGMAVRSVLDLVQEANPSYEWHEADSLIEVAPTVLFRDPQAPLNRMISALDLTDVDARTALLAARLAVDPLYRAPNKEIYIGPRLSERAKEQGARHFSVQFAGGTARHLLNAIIAAHGELVWIVEYEPPQANADQMTVSLMSFDGWGIALPPQKRN